MFVHLNRNLDLETKLKLFMDFLPDYEGWRKRVHRLDLTYICIMYGLDNFVHRKWNKA